MVPSDGFGPVAEVHSEQKRSLKFAKRKPLARALASWLRAQLGFAFPAALRVERHKALTLNLSSS